MYLVAVNLGHSKVHYKTMSFLLAVALEKKNPATNYI